MLATCLLASCSAAVAVGIPPTHNPDPRLGYDLALDDFAVAEPGIAPAEPFYGNVPHSIEPVSAAPVTTRRDGLRIGRVHAFRGGKLRLTNGISTVEGASGGGIASWATIAGRQMPGGIGLSGHATLIELSDFGWRSYGVALGFGDRLELSYSRANFDTRKAGALLGLGQGYVFNQETYGAKLRVVGDLVYGSPWLPQIAVGVEHKRNQDGNIVRALGAADDSGTDYTVSATKLLLGQSMLVNATLRYTEANELGLLGFGSASGKDYRLQFEGSVGYLLSRRAVIGAEFRSKPDNLGLGEDDWMDVFAAFSMTENLTVSAAYVDLGSIATFADQRGGFLSLQVAF